MILGELLGLSKPHVPYHKMEARTEPLHLGFKGFTWYDVSQVLSIILAHGDYLVSVNYCEEKHRGWDTQETGQLRGGQRRCGRCNIRQDPKKLA